MGLPSWQDTPGQINLPVLLWLHNLLEAWDLEVRQGSLPVARPVVAIGFAGANADAIDADVSITELDAVLQASPWRHRIPGHPALICVRLAGEPQMRLSSVERPIQRPPGVAGWEHPQRGGIA